MHMHFEATGILVGLGRNVVPLDVLLAAMQDFKFKELFRVVVVAVSFLSPTERTWHGYARLPI